MIIDLFEGVGPMRFYSHQVRVIEEGERDIICNVLNEIKVVVFSNLIILEDIIRFWVVILSVYEGING